MEEAALTRNIKIGDMSGSWNHSDGTQTPGSVNGSIPGEGAANRLPQLAPPAVNIQIKPDIEQQQQHHHVTLPSISTISSANGGGNSVVGTQHGHTHGHTHTHSHSQTQSHVQEALPGVSASTESSNSVGLHESTAGGNGASIVTKNNIPNSATSIQSLVQPPEQMPQQSQTQIQAQAQAQAHQPQQPIIQTHASEMEQSMGAGQDSSYRPLNVKDALSYLEQVKFQFNTRPDVYNHFLDIMKDFKSQAIDTPGVIQRVTTLFQGFPNLIQGFNTFLPHGYKIECSSNPDDPIKVTTPFGTTGEVSAGPPLQQPVQATPQGQQPQQQPQQLGSIGSMKMEDQNVERQQQQQQPQQQQQQQHNLPQVGGSNQGQPPQLQEQSKNQQHTLLSQQPTQPQQSSPPQQMQPQAQPQAQVQQALPQTQPVAQQLVNQNFSATNAAIISGMPGQQKAGEVEFSHAISYVNKIKTRFADQPDIYKQFLEILQTYQREQKPINEVYAQVTVLFQQNPDLLDDFKKFLPDSSVAPQQNIQSSPQENQQNVLSSQPYIPQGHPIQGQGYYGQPGIVMQQTNLPPLGNFSASGQASPPETNHMLPSMHQHISGGQVLPQHVVTQGMSNQEIPVSDMRSTMNGAYNQMEYMQAAAGYQQQMDGMQYMEAPMARPEIDLDPSLVPVVPEPIQPPEDAVALSDEVTFFDRVKRFIGNKQVYAEFLKILNLYSHDLLSTSELVSKVEFYLENSKELFDWFKSFVGYEEKPKNIENIVHEKHRLDLDLCEACGPSYKKLPKDDTFMPCSGRDEMCWEVLNDEWVGHPVWASEDSGFIAHRKNQYEDTLFKIEEERHEYDFYIESNLRTIQTLETIANKIANMTQEEKNNFKLPPGLGHTSLTIYKKVIRKVYDKDRGFEIIDALHEHPAVTVPIVLKRLKQKDEEWRRAQREWNKVWRELEQKVYYKSLDHLGLTFKQADKKLLTTKQLISEISSIKVDQTNKRIHPLTPKPKSQLDFDINDHDVLFDILDLIFTFLHANATYSNPDKVKLQQFFKVFISLFFSIPVEEVEEAVKKRFSMAEQESAEEETNPNEPEKSNKRSLQEEDSLSLREILRRNKNARSSTSEENGSNSSTKANEKDETEIIAGEAAKPWLLGSLVDEANSSGVVENRHLFNLFANTTIYVFFRHLNTMYERLSEVKVIDKDVTEEIQNRKVVQFASDLNLVSTQLSDMGLDFKGTKAYDELLRLSKRLIVGDLDHQWFEESLRQAYKNKAFKIYTVDKVIQSLVKHAHSIISDPKNSMVLILFEQDRLKKDTTAKEQILYRLKVRNTIGESENMFRIEFNSKNSHTCIQYVAVDDLTLKEPQNMKEKWDYYVTSYSLSHPTEGVAEDQISQPFLEKIVEKEAEYIDEEEPNKRYSPEGISESKLKVKIHPETYQLSFEPGSSDVFTRKSVNSFPEPREANTADKMRNFLDGSNGWKKNIPSADAELAEAKTKDLKENGVFKIDEIKTDKAEESNGVTNAEESKIIDK